MLFKSKLVKSAGIELGEDCKTANLILPFRLSMISATMTSEKYLLASISAVRTLTD